MLLLKGGDACVLVRAGRRRFEVVFPGPEAAAVPASADELASEYTGFILAASPVEISAGSRPEARLIDLRAPGLDGHWLWGTLKRFLPYYRASMLAALLSNVLMLVSGLVMSVVYDKVIPHQAFVTLWTLAVWRGHRADVRPLLTPAAQPFDRPGRPQDRPHRRARQVHR